jgi:methyl acetate hydrolase
MKQLKEVDQALREAADARDVPGVVAMAATGSEVIYQGAFGKRDLGNPEAMTLDTVFWIASMTKAITGAAAMQLVKLSLDGPIGKTLPEIADMQVLEGLPVIGSTHLAMSGA